VQPVAVATGKLEPAEARRARCTIRACLSFTSTL
jgi:hypothetical protein